jgi:hypothetical protein
MGKAVWFESGFFATEDRALQKMIESNDSFGTLITFQDEQVVLDEKAKQAEAEKMQGAYKSDDSQDASRKLAAKIGLGNQETEQMISDRKALAEKVEAATIKRKMGRPSNKVKEMAHAI